MPGAAMTSLSTVTALSDQFASFHARFAPLFYRAEVRQRSASYLQALLSPVTRKNGWQVAEAMGEPDPNGAQRLLGSARWDADAVRDTLRAVIMETFGDPVDGVLVVDETGVLKKGTQSVGVARQYSGMAGKVDNCQVGVILLYASPSGAAFMDRRLYLPDSWTDDRERLSVAKVPDEIVFQAKPQLARTMLADAFAAGVTAGWVVADSLYGCDRSLRLWLERRRQPYVLAVRRDERVWLMAGAERRRTTVAAATTALPASAWERHSAGMGVQGERWYDWGWLPVTGLLQVDWGHWLLARRSLSEPSEVAWYLVAGPAGMTVARAAPVAGARWTIEAGLEEAKGETGLDDYEVRHWHSWHRHVTLALVAHAFLAWSRQTARLVEAGPSGGNGQPEHGVDRANAARDTSLALLDAAAPIGISGIPPGVVSLATTASGDGSTGPPAATRRSTRPRATSRAYVTL